ncbi:TetR/AcrR family transcriptional regulator [Mycobacteroides abscessus]|uniref:TetR/AcrR family transcriptional regulator n=1 Tax=Mycobacteroides abscessus TaxID=36809 RepID=UPI0009275B66|nr:TetR/AcrR family transcriptional regulator [Mycobacteroides abscessus]MDO3333890.1 TetR/AcrR family transcriptional regulator [Mycobacteroides abscessus subsp. bolletii]QSM86894.1 TetR/AcrR family transcriptional regulator [Mycobacteroides abscessus subsp. bolletii]SIB88946.1 transcriptional regulator [Mycobacteroides abscessus subsp. bolletii]SKS88786.1 transcriptional regulator [Mycobacteroides abscessus subsp. bolletii]SKT11686.1 transcriptional regulator [Mycobacteroides abscessus subsp
MTADSEPTSRRRILEATRVVLGRSGLRNLQLSEVAVEAGVSRPTLYRHFGSKEGLLEEFSLYEQDRFDAGILAAMAGLTGDDRLDAALRFVVDFQHTHSSSSMIDIEPGHVLAQMRRVLPIMLERIRRVIPGENSEIAASAVVRIAVCHYLVQQGTPERFLAELRLAAGLHPRRRMPRTAAS